MNPSQGFSCRGQAGKDSLVTTKKTPGGDFLVVRLDSRAETRATKRPGEDLVVRLDSWDETRATKWTLFILRGDFLVGAMAWTTKRPEKKMVVRLDSGAETRATISCWEVAGMPPSEDPLVTTKRAHLGGVDGLGGHGFDDQEDGLPSHDRQQLGGGRGATRRVHLGGVDGLGGQGQRGSQMLPAGRGLGGLDPGVGCGVKQGAASILDVGQNRYQGLGIASNLGRSQSPAGG